MTPLMPLASLGMLLWWAATSSAMPLDKSGALYEADGPAAHKRSLQPVRRGVHLQDFERTRTCKNVEGVGKYDGQDCCTVPLDQGEQCEDKTYRDAGKNCHKFFYFNGAEYKPCRNPHFKKEGNACKSTATFSTMVCGEAPGPERAAENAKKLVEFAEVKQKFDANQLGVEGMLRGIIKYSRPDVLIELVRNNRIDANFAVNGLPTPLMIAVHQRDDAEALQMVQTLLARGANADQRVTLPSDLADNNRPPVVNAPFHTSALHEACNVGCQTMWGRRKYYYAGDYLDVNLARGPAKETTARIRIVEELLASGARAEFNARYDEDNEMLHQTWKPIHWAIFNGYTQIALRLVRSAFPNHFNRYARAWSAAVPQLFL